MFFVRGSEIWAAHFLIATKRGIKMRVGLKKKMYKDGRIMIPKEFRELYHFKGDSELSIINTPEGVLITNPDYKMVKKTKIAPLMKSGYSDKTMVEALRILLEVIKWQQKESVFQDTVQPR